MRQKIRMELKKIYEAPKPPDKRAFIRKVNMQPIPARHMVWMQILYISKWEWALSAFVLGIALVMSRFFEIIALSTAAAMMPFLAAASIAENMRSVTHGMKELEMSARFSLKSILLARMSVLGIENIILTMVLAFLVKGQFISTILYLLVPYLFSTYVELCMVRKLPGSEGVDLCMGISAAVSIAVITMRFHKDIWIFQEAAGLFWIAAVVMLLYMNLQESRKMIIYMAESI